MIVGLMQNKSAIEKLAQNWDILPFKKVLKDSSGGNIKIKSKETLEKGLLPVIDQGKEFIAGYTDNINATANVSLPLIIFGDHTRILKYVDFEFAMGADGTKVLEIINNDAYPKFIYYYLKSVNIIDTGYNRHFKYIKDLVFPQPPLKTQKRLAGILDDAAALRDKTAQLLTEYDLLAQSIFLQMFGDPVLNQKNWETKKLIQVSKQITDGTHHSPEPTKSGFPYVTAKHIKQMSLEFDSKPTFVSKEAHEEIYSRCKPELNDVLLIKDGATTGVACLNSFNEPISLLSSVGLIKPNKQLLNPTFLVFWFNHTGVKQQLIRKFMSGAAIKRYTISKMKKFDLIVPPIELQNQFAEIIALIEQQKSLAKQELQESEDLFNCLLQKAFKGEL